MQLELERAKLEHRSGRTEISKNLVMKLIKLDPGNELYWLYLYIFTQISSPLISKSALFKAYDINPSSSLVLNSLISFYF